MNKLSAISRQLSGTRKTRGFLPLLKADSRKLTAGFTLIEMMVAVALFSIVMLVSTSSLLALVDANRKAQALHSVMENLNIAVDSMERAVRMGSSYHCGTSGLITAPQDCSTTGGTYLAFENYGGDPTTSSDQRIFWFAADSDGIGRLWESRDGGATRYPVTAPEVGLDVSATGSRFYVTGTTVQDAQQPKVIVVIKGKAENVKIKAQTSFTIQASASQRALDL